MFKGAPSVEKSDFFKTKSQPALLATRERIWWVFLFLILFSSFAFLSPLPAWCSAWLVDADCSAPCSFLASLAFGLSRCCRCVAAGEPVQRGQILSRQTAPTLGEGVMFHLKKFHSLPLPIHPRVPACHEPPFPGKYPDPHPRRTVFRLAVARDWKSRVSFRPRPPPFFRQKPRAGEKDLCQRCSWRDHAPPAPHRPLQRAWGLA